MGGGGGVSRDLQFFGALATMDIDQAEMADLLSTAASRELYACFTAVKNASYGVQTMVTELLSLLEYQK